MCALREFPILGVRTNTGFLLRVLEHPRFRAGDVDTGWLDAEGASFAAESGDVPAHVQAAVSAYESEAGPQSHEATQASQSDPWQSLREWRT